MFKAVAPANNGTLDCLGKNVALFVANTDSALTWITPSTTNLFPGTTIYITNELSGVITVRNPANTATISVVRPGTIRFVRLSGSLVWEDGEGYEFTTVQQWVNDTFVTGRKVLPLGEIPITDTVVTPNKYGATFEGHGRGDDINPAHTQFGSVSNIYWNTTLTDRPMFRVGTKQSTFRDMQLSGDKWNLTVKGKPTAAFLIARGGDNNPAGEVSFNNISILGPLGAAFQFAESYSEGKADVTRINNCDVNRLVDKCIYIKNGNGMGIRMSGCQIQTSSYRGAAISTGNPANIGSTGHGLTTGQTIYLSESVSTPDINGPHTVTVVDSNNFTIPVNLTSISDTGRGWSPVSPIEEASVIYAEAGGGVTIRDTEIIKRCNVVTFYPVDPSSPYISELSTQRGSFAIHNCKFDLNALGSTFLNCREDAQLSNSIRTCVKFIDCDFAGANSTIPADAWSGILGGGATLEFIRCQFAHAMRHPDDSPIFKFFEHYTGGSGRLNRLRFFDCQFRSGIGDAAEDMVDLTQSVGLLSFHFQDCYSESLEYANVSTILEGTM